MTMADAFDDLHKKRQHLSDWIVQHKANDDILPQVQQSLELTEWEIGALEGRPTVSGEVPYAADIRSYAAADRALWESALPQLPSYDHNTIVTAGSATTSGTAIFYRHVAAYCDTGDAAAVRFASEETAKYRALQERQRRVSQVRGLIQRLCSQGTLDRFDVAERACAKAKAEVTTKTDAANAVRNVLQGLKGDLFAKARRQPKENMSWPAMAQRLGRGAKERQLLLENEPIYSSLFKDLSEMLKDRPRSSAPSLEDLWTQTLDLLLSVLGLV